MRVRFLTRLQFVDDDWLAANDLMPPTPPATSPPSPVLTSRGLSKDEFGGATIRSLRLKPVTAVLSDSSCADAVETMRDKGFDQLPVLTPTGGRLVGLVTLGNLLSWIQQGRATGKSPVSDVMFDFTKLSEVVRDPRDIQQAVPASKSKSSMTNGLQSKAGSGSRRKFVEITMDTPLSALSRFFEWYSAAIVTEKKPGEEEAYKPVAVVTKVDLLTWLVKRTKLLD